MRAGVALLGLWLGLSAVGLAAGALTVDPNGYVLYCPCMGRFGNQAEHFLGALAFSRGLNRTLVLPPWVEYHPRQRNSVQVAFDTYFDVSAVQEYHRAITMETFMKRFAPKIWPVGQRSVFCYQARNSKKGCDAKEGNPFGPFWDTFSIDFDHSEFYGPLSYLTDVPGVKDQWDKQFPVRTHAIMAFTGAPASFPVREEHVGLQRYVRWSADYRARADRYIADHLTRPFIGIHLRRGSDWARACEHVESSRGNMFASGQCLGYHNEHGALSADLCSPPDATVIKQLKKAVKKYKAKSVYIATDSDPMIAQFKKAMKKVEFVTQFTDPYRDPNSPHLDLAILASADHYICNCISTFSAFAVRERRVHERSVEFWAFTPSKHAQDEL